MSTCEEERKKENTLSPSDSVCIPSLFVISWQQLTGVNVWADVTAGSGWCPVAGHHVPKHIMTQTITITIPHMAHGHCLLKKVKNNSKVLLSFQSLSGSELIKKDHCHSQDHQNTPLSCFTLAACNKHETFRNLCWASSSYQCDAITVKQPNVCVMEEDTCCEDKGRCCPKSQCTTGKKKLLKKTSCSSF